MVRPIRPDAGFRHCIVKYSVLHGRTFHLHIWHLYLKLFPKMFEYVSGNRRLDGTKYQIILLHMEDSVLIEVDAV